MNIGRWSVSLKSDPQPTVENDYAGFGSYNLWGVICSLKLKLNRDDPHNNSKMMDLYPTYSFTDVNVNVTDTISWRGHHDRVMQLN